MEMPLLGRYFRAASEGRPASPQTVGGRQPPLPDIVRWITQRAPARRSRLPWLGAGSCRSPSRNKALTLQRVFDLIARIGAGRRGHGPTGDPGVKAPAKRETLLM